MIQRQPYQKRLLFAIAILATGSLSGESPTRLDAAHFLDPTKRVCIIVADTSVDRDLNRLITGGILRREVGPDAFTVERVEDHIHEPQEAADVNMLEKVQRGPTPKPPRVLCYGVEGVGKSTLASEAPKPVFVQCEDGLDQINCDKFPLATSLDDVVAALTDLRREKHNYGTVVIDSLSWLERLIWGKLCEQHGVSSIEKVDGGYARGYTHALTYWREIIDHLNALRNENGMVVLLIAHSKIERFEDPESSSYDRFVPRLHKHASALICEWCDAVLFATRKIRTQSEDAGFNRKRTIAHALGAGGGERILRCVGGPSCVAKNRYGITEELPLKWAAFVQAMSTKQQQGAKKDG